MTRFTIWGLYSYDPTLFDGVEVPEGLELDGIIDEIMERSGDLYCYYQQPKRMKSNIAHWFHVRKIEFEAMFKALRAEYSPIENYDRYEDSTETPNITNTVNSSTTTESSTQSNSEVTNKRSAFDSAEFANDAQTSAGASDSNSGSAMGNSTTSETGTRDYTSHIHGNIGVTTAQQMIEAELNLRKHNLYEIIAKEFETKFLIQIY